MARRLSTYGLGGRLSELTIDDPALFESLVTRMIEDVDLATYAIAIRDGARVINKNAVDQTFRLLVPPPQTQPTFVEPREGFEDPRFEEQLRLQVEGLARAPLVHEPDGIQLLTRYLAWNIIAMLQQAADSALAEGETRIRSRHLIPACEQWFYPLNRYC